MFDEKKYYNYIQKLEKRLDYYYVFSIGIGAILGAYLYYIKGIIIGCIMGLLIANYFTLKTKIKIQKMKWEIDMYRK